MQENQNSAVSAPGTQARQHWLQQAVQMVRGSLAPTALMAVVWLVLGWVRSAGVQWAILWPLNFLTGALNGLEGSALGGTIGKAILLVLFNGFFRGIIVRRKNGGRWRTNFWEELKKEGFSAVQSRIPQYTNIRMLLEDRSPRMIGCGLLGGAAALLAYPFLTGNGAVGNSMVCVALFISIGGQIARQRGLLITLLNFVLARKSLHTVNRDAVNRVFAGFALGMAVAVPIAAMRNIPNAGTALWFCCARVLPWLMAAAAIACLIWPFVRARRQPVRADERQEGTK